MKDHSGAISWMLTSASILFSSIKFGMVSMVTSIDFDIVSKAIAIGAGLSSMTYTLYKFYRRLQKDLHNIDNETNDAE